MHDSRYGVILDCLPPKVHPPNKFRILILTSDYDTQPLEEKGWTITNSPEDNFVPESKDLKFEMERRLHQFLYFCIKDPIAFVPKINSAGYHSHTMIEVDYDQILEIVDRVVRVDSDTIMGDIRRRESPRFK